MANEEEQERIVTEIESRLKDDQDGSFRASVASGIDEQLGAIDAALRKGVPPAEGQELQKLKAGFESARDILERTWSSFHR